MGGKKLAYKRRARVGAVAYVIGNLCKEGPPMVGNLEGSNSEGGLPQWRSQLKKGEPTRGKMEVHTREDIPPRKPYGKLSRSRQGALLIKTGHRGEAISEGVGVDVMKRDGVCQGSNLVFGDPQCCGWP